MKLILVISQDDCPDFEAMNWFKLLMFYDFQEGVELDPNDPDSHLIPEWIDRVIVPRITCKNQYL